MPTRRIHPADAALLRAIRLRALESDPLAFGSTHAREVSRTMADWEAWAGAHASGPDKATFLAIDGQRALGIAAGMRDTDDTTRFGLFSMWVAPEARRSGVGRALVLDVLAWATAHGGACIRLWVTQPGAIAFYERCGFADDGRREPLAHTPSVIEVGMTRTLNPARVAARRDE